VLDAKLRKARKERGQIAPSYEKVLKLGGALDIDMARLFGPSRFSLLVKRCGGGRNPLDGHGRSRPQGAHCSEAGSRCNLSVTRKRFYGDGKVPYTSAGLLPSSDP